MRKKFFCVFVCILLAFSTLTGCSHELPNTAEVLYAMTDAETCLPAGRIYLSGAPEGSENFVPDSLLLAMYGEGKAPAESEGWIEFALFAPSGKHPCEMAVFLCRDNASSIDTGKMLCRRLDAIKHAWADTEHSAYVNDAEVVISKNFCVLIVSSDTEAVKNAAMSLIK